MHTVKSEIRNQKSYSNQKSEIRKGSSFWFRVSSLIKVSSFEFQVFRGFTLPEVIVATAIALVLSGGVVLFFARQPKQFSDTISALTSQRQGQRALAIMTRELRGATSGADGGAPLRDAHADTLTFTADVNTDGMAEMVTYTASGTTLTRNITEPAGSPSRYPNTPTSTSTLATSLTSTVIFRYLSAPGVYLAVDRAIEAKMIEIELPITSARLEGTVLLRNLL